MPTPALRLLPVPLPRPRTGPREAERLTAAALLRCPEFALDVFERCSESDFSDDLCAAVYRASLTLATHGGGSNGVADVYGWLRAEGRFGDMLPRLLWDLWSETPTGVMGAYHANLVRANGERRWLKYRMLAAIRDMDDGRAAADVLSDIAAG